MLDLGKTTEIHPDQKDSEELKQGPVRALHRHWCELHMVKLKRPGEGELPRSML